MILSEEAFELIATINDNWTNNQIVDRAVPVWLRELMRCDRTFEQLINGLACLVATERFRPTVADLVEAATPAPQQLVVDELSDLFPLTETINGNLWITGHYNLLTREKTTCHPYRPSKITSKPPLQISEF